MRAYFLVHTIPGMAADVARRAAAIDRVAAAEVVTGPYDVMVMAEAAHPDVLAREVGARIETIPGVIRAIACPQAGHEHIWEMGREPTLAGAWHPESG